MVLICGGFHSQEKFSKGTGARLKTEKNGNQHFLEQVYSADTFH